jgi:hypothetical protein
MTNKPILATTITLVFDVSSAPVYVPQFYGPMFPKTLRIEVFDGGSTSVTLAAFKAKKDGTESATKVSPYVPMADRENVPWIAKCIELAKLYAANVKWVNGQGAVL